MGFFCCCGGGFFCNYYIRFALLGTPSADLAIIFVFGAHLTMFIKALNQFLEIIVMFKGFLKKNRVSFVSWVSGIM